MESFILGRVSDPALPQGAGSCSLSTAERDRPLPKNRGSPYAARGLQSALPWDRGFNVRPCPNAEAG